MKRNWRRTSLRQLDDSVEFTPDDWTLVDNEGRALARIYHYAFGPQAGRWSWFVLVGPDATPRNSGTGTADKEAAPRDPLKSFSESR